MVRRTWLRKCCRPLKVLESRSVCSRLFVVFAPIFESAQKQQEQLFVVASQAVRDGSDMDRTNEPIIAAFAIALRQARQRAGLTQEDLAERAEVSVRFISFLETGKRQPSLSALAAVSSGLGLTMSQLVSCVEQLLGSDDGPEIADDRDWPAL